ncbi:MAG: ROK family transcriptional regulator [Bacillota bacterium]
MVKTIRFADMSTGNRAAILRLIHDHGPISRAELVRTTGFSAPAVSRMVNDLMSLELVAERPGSMETGAGRPPVLLSFRGADWSAISVSIFPEQTRVGLFDLRGRVLEEVDRPTDSLVPEEAFAAVGSLVEELRRRAPDPARIAGIGVALPGLIDGPQVLVRYSPPTGWRDLAIAPLLRPYTDLPTVVENWVSARAQAERHYGGARHVEDFIYVHASQGIGAAVVSHGTVGRGQTFSNAEFGHVPLTADGPVCRCGRRGCLEAYASMTALPRYARRPEADPDEILALARSGDPVGRQAVEEALGYLSLGLIGLVHLLNPTYLFLDGWPTVAGESAIESLRGAIRVRGLEGLASAVTLVPSELGGLSPLIGGVALVLNAVLDLNGEIVSK